MVTNTPVIKQHSALDGIWPDDILAMTFYSVKSKHVI